jgi:folate-dependent tRNA-U54 methylase TrmFO/GidA
MAVLRYGVSLAYGQRNGWAVEPGLQASLGTRAFGCALLAHITRGGNVATFQPMNVNFGVRSLLDARIRVAERKPALARRALADLQAWLAALAQAA